MSHKRKHVPPKGNPAKAEVPDRTEKYKTGPAAPRDARPLPPRYLRNRRIS